MKTLLNHLQFAARYVLISFITSLALLTVFIYSAYQHGTFSTLLYGLSIPSYYYLIYLLLTLMLTPLLYFNQVAVLIIIPKVLLDLFLLADILVFNIYRFHIDMLFIEMAIFDFQGIGLSWGMSLLVIMVAIAVVALQVFIYGKAKQLVNMKTTMANIGIITLFLLGQGIHIWGNYTKQESILTYTPYMPYYAPITSTALMSKLHQRYPELIVIHNSSNATIFNNQTSSQRFNYPIKPLVFDKGDKKAALNVLLFVVESWRADMLTSEVTPYIAEFAKRSHQFENHYSGGNVTVSGLFSLMYGLNPSYLASAQAAPFKYQTMLTKSFAQQGYDISSYSGSNFNRFAMKPMFFGEIDERLYIYPQQGRSSKNDKKVAEKVIADIKLASNDKPWFKFVFLTSSHHDYDYPEQYKKFIPTPKITAEFLVNKHIHAQPFLNDYQNSLHYIDALFNQIHQALINSGQDKNTLIIITADHGEEFNDNKQGYWGHGSNFTKAQTTVPLVMHIPGEKNLVKEINRSAHVDIVPTLLRHVLNTASPLSHFSSGFDLFDLPIQRGVAMASYKDKAYLVDNTVYSSGLITNKYHINDLNKKPDAINYQQLQILRQQDSHFLQ
ncbi:sulfatase-like hydrolase/transferase [Colwellia piezophila]|uniref:sulfatase-like hydrolase/transferase n=1 Tax=Colwellia piezophila TaxID=211668 RepID=UPI000380B485|nr:sulfatase-like hydrolase/transferase [Colwellia piezophila]